MNKGSSDQDYEVNDWKSELPRKWKGNNMTQRGVASMGFTSIIQIPNMRDAILFRKLVNAETNRARLTGYNVKIVECSGIQLVRLLPQTFE